MSRERSVSTFLGYVISAARVSVGQRKVSAVTTWPTPTTVKELQSYLGFASFYWYFIQGFSTIAAPLTALLKKKLNWNPAAEEAFTHMKRIFTMAPVLMHSDPSCWFTVEVEASDVGVGGGSLTAVRQRTQASSDSSIQLTPTDVGNRELLAVKLALEERRHWLTGATYPFVILTDHKNLEYLHTAKRLNASLPRGLSRTLDLSRTLSPSNLNGLLIWPLRTSLQPTALPRSRSPDF